MRAKSIGAVFCLWVCSAGSASALGLDELPDARAALAEYDLEGDRTTSVIARLGEQIPSLGGADAREARFIRAVAAADLFLLAQHHGGDGTLRERVAGALGLGETEVVPHLRAELATLAVGVYAETAIDARDALGLLARSRDREGDWADSRAAGARRDLAFLGALVAALERDASVRDVLASFSTDPCARRQRSSCPSPFDRLSATDRRAAAAIASGFAAIARLERAHEGGDPFALAISDFVERAREVLAERRAFRATPALPAALSVVTVASRERRGPDVDAIVLLADGALHWGWVPHVSVRDDGEVELVAPEGPVLPATDRVALPPELRAALVPVGEVAPLFEALVRRDARVAIGAAPTAEGHVLARVLLTARRAGVASPHLIVRDAEGFGRAIPTELASGEESDALRRDVGVYVRLGGYSFSIAGTGVTDLPRVEGPDRQWRHDVQGLAAHAHRARYSTAKVRFMSSVPAGPLFAAAFAVAPGSGPLTLVLP